MGLDGDLFTYNQMHLQYLLLKIERNQIYFFGIIQQEAYGAVATLDLYIIKFEEVVLPSQLDIYPMISSDFNHLKQPTILHTTFWKRIYYLRNTAPTILAVAGAAAAAYLEVLPKQHIPESERGKLAAIDVSFFITHLFLHLDSVRQNFVATFLLFLTLGLLEFTNLSIK
ncbi:hypothetical protein ACJX0J_017378, partial [Zea mays]